MERNIMRTELIKRALAPALLILGLAAGGAEAFVSNPVDQEVLGAKSLLTPAAMCGYSCRSGGRYIPGPPSVCYEHGLNFCGSSRDVGPPRGGGGPYGWGSDGERTPRRLSHHHDRAG
jgi:hypothetical protein